MCADEDRRLGGATILATWRLNLGRLVVGCFVGLHISGIQEDDTVVHEEDSRVVMPTTMRSISHIGTPKISDVMKSTMSNIATQ